jgi:lipoate---protein ligase
VSWRVERRSLRATEFHALDIPDPAERAVWVADPTGPALVLGSSQPDADVRPGVDLEVVRRRSGGGAVLLVPGEVVWLDVIVPRGSGSGDRGGLDDVRASMCRIGTHVGEALVAAVPELADRVAVHRAAMETTPWSSTICFDGLGPGEVLLDAVKLVGLSQRLTRQAARFQACWHTAYDVGALLDLLPAASRPPRAVLRPVATLDAAASAAVPELLRAALSTP